MRLGAKKSIVWKFFNKSEDNKFATCTLCDKKLKYFTSTTNLKSHLARLHPIQYNNKVYGVVNTENEDTDNESSGQQEQFQENSIKCEPEDPEIFESSPQPTSSREFTRDDSAESEEVATNKRLSDLQFSGIIKKRPLPLSEAQQKSIDRSLVKMITLDYHPLSTVEYRGFLEYTSNLNPLYTPPSRKILTNILMPELYNEAVSKIISMLQTVDYISLTTDIWKADNKSYLTLTSHFVYGTKMHSHVLATREMTNVYHTGESIAETLSNIFTDWKIEDKIVIIVSNNESNIKNAISEQLHKPHHPCVAHTLNLCVQEALNSKENVFLSTIIQKCTTLVEYFSQSVVASNKLKNYQEQMGLPIVNMKQYVVTRWTSCLVMMERLLQLKEPLCITLTDNGKALGPSDNSEWAILSDCVLLLKPFESMTTELSGDKYTSMSLTIPLVRGLQHNVKNMFPNTDTGRTLQRNLLDVVSKRLGCYETYKIAAKATFLDPRLKMAAFGLDENAKNAEKWVSDELIQMIDEQNIVDETVSTLPTESMSEGKQSLWSHFHAKLAEVNSSMTATINVTHLLREYIETPYLPINENPFLFWEAHKYTLPELYKLHLKYLCIPATSVPADSMFSEAGQLTNLRRNSLQPKYLDQIIFLNSYF